MTRRLLLTIMITLCFGVCLTCCSGNTVKSTPVKPAPSWKVSLLDETVGAMAELQGQHRISVRGYGLVMGLAGTGSRECPDHILQIIREGLRGRTRPDGRPLLGKTDLPTLINSPTTAVVLVNGFVPPAAAAGDKIDLTISALPITQTTSLAGGELFITELAIEVISSQGTPVRKRPMVLAGHPRPAPVFINPFAPGDPAERPAFLQSGRIIGGGRVLQSRPLRLVLRVPGGSYRMAKQIGERLNFRFPSLPGQPRTAEPESRTTVRLMIPRDYRGRQRHFLMLVMQTYLSADPLYITRKTDQLLGELANPESDAERITAALESIGKSTIPDLRRAYQSPVARVRFYAARTGALLDDKDAVSILAAFAADNTSAFQLPATVALGELPSRYRSNQALRPLLENQNTLVRIQAYEALAKNQDPSVKSVTFEQPAEFGLHLVRSYGQPLIYVQTSKHPRIVLFGDIRCQLPLFYLSRDKLLTITSQQQSSGPKQEPIQNETREPLEQLSVLRRTPSGEIGLRLKTSADLVSLIKTLGSDVEPDYKGIHYGLGMNYSQTVAALYGLWQQKFVQAGFFLQRSPGARELFERPPEPGGQRPETARP